MVQPFSRWLMAALVAVLILLMVESGFSQSSVNEDNNNNTVIRRYCGRNQPISPSNFVSNLNDTLDELRSRISVNGVYYARAQSLGNGDSVYGAILCRNYLSTGQCLACFDAAVTDLATCTTGNGAYVFFNNCYLRYANYADYYNSPDIIEDVGFTPLGICGGQLASQSEFNQTIQGLLSDIRVATARTPDLYVASTRQIPGSNATIYAIAQCTGNLSQSTCQGCIDTGYNTLSNCLPTSEAMSIDMGCFMRYSETPFFQDNQTTNIAPFLSTGGKKSSKVGVIAGAIGGVGAFSLVVAAFLWYRLRKKSNAANEDTTEFEGAVNYNYKDLQLATNNFSDENLIGKGGFGEVFKAIIDGENVVAVKKIQVGHGAARAEVENEIKLISNVHHRNLTRLIGWSSEGSELLIVLEYMPKGSLDKYLWGAKKGTLNWKQRYDIIFGIARGLVHLHDEFHIKIVHRDIKSNNILLDDDFQPKIADFGLAKLQPADQTHVSTKFAGTLGYTAPEYALHGKLSEKVDTYSFGIVVLEIISGRRCTDVNSGGPYTDYLLEHAWKVYENNEHWKFIDESLDRNEFEEEHVTRIIEIALLCTQSPASMRPTMSEVVLMLSSGQSFGQRQQLTRPTFIDRNRRIHIGSYKGNSRGKKDETPKNLREKKLDTEEDEEEIQSMENGRLFRKI